MRSAGALSWTITSDWRLQELPDPGGAGHTGLLAACKASICPLQGAPRTDARLGVCCQSALPGSHKLMGSWKEIWAPEAQEAGPWASSAIDTAV